MTDPTAVNAPVLEVRGVSKSFPGVRALDRVDFDVRPGEVHALVGENGAGKSTLLKLLAGLFAPDEGQIFLDGQPTRLVNPHRARQLGIAMIHQELTPFPNLSVAENLFMGREPAGWFPGSVGHREMRERAATLLSQLGVTVPPSTRLGRLTLARQQLVEIARAAAFGARLILMDEPTSALSQQETEALFAIVSDLRRRGAAIVYTSHKLDEVFRLADRVTVLRDGRHVATQPAAGVSSAQLIAQMAGRELDVILTRPGGPAPPPRARADEPPLLAVRNLTVPGLFESVSFEVRAGEIVGCAGLMGAGRTEVASAVYGLIGASTGEVALAGRPLPRRSPQAALARGLAMVTEDRQGSGIVPRLSVRANLTLSSLRRWCRGPVVDARAEANAAAGCLARLRIRAAGDHQLAGQLSGGNQQKIVIARALLTEPRVLILDEPTRGIDVGAKAEIYALVEQLARDGLGILLISSELPELLALSHRILVFRDGTITADVPAAQTTQEDLLHLAMPQ